MRRWWWLLLAVGCNGEPEAEDTGPIGLSGTVTWADTLMGYDSSGTLEDSCTATYDLVGEQVDLDDCWNCDWAVEVSSTVASDDCTDDPPNQEVTLQQLESGGPMYLVRWLGGEGVLADGGAIATIVDGEFTPLGGLGSFSQTGRGETLEIDGTSVSWNFEWGPRAYFGRPVHSGTCTTSDSFATGSTVATGGTSATLDCTLGLADVWTVTVAAAGDVAISVDVPSGGLTPELVVIDPSGCMVRTANLTGDCSGGGECVAGTLTATVAGDYTVLVSAYVDPMLRPDPDCATNPYTLDVQGATATLTESAAERYESYWARYADVTAEGTTTRALE